MATNPQSLVQPIAQGNVPFHANNGNPFTIYNQIPNQGGYIPPTMDARGNWMINPLSQFSQPIPFWMQQWAPQYQGFQPFGTPQFGTPQPPGQPFPTMPPPPGTEPPIMSDPLPPVGTPMPGARGPVPPRPPGEIRINGTPLNNITGALFGGGVFTPTGNGYTGGGWSPFAGGGGAPSTIFGGDGFGSGAQKLLNLFGGGAYQAGTNTIDWTAVAGSANPMIGLARQLGLWAQQRGLPMPGWMSDHLQKILDSKQLNSDVLNRNDVVNKYLTKGMPPDTGGGATPSPQGGFTPSFNPFSSGGFSQGSGWGPGQINPITGQVQTPGQFNTPFGPLNPSAPWLNPGIPIGSGGGPPLRGLATGSRMIGATYDPNSPEAAEAREMLHDALRRGFKPTRQAGGDIRGNMYEF